MCCISGRSQQKNLELREVSGGFVERVEVPNSEKPLEILFFLQYGQVREDYRLLIDKGQPLLGEEKE